MSDNNNNNICLKSNIQTSSVDYTDICEDKKSCRNNSDWAGEVSKERRRLLAEYEYLLNFFVVQLVYTTTVGQYDQLKVKINSLYRILP